MGPCIVCLHSRASKGQPVLRTSLRRSSPPLCGRNELSTSAITRFWAFGSKACTSQLRKVRGHGVALHSLACSIPTLYSANRQCLHVPWPRTSMEDNLWPSRPLWESVESRGKQELNSDVRIKVKVLLIFRPRMAMHSTRALLNARCKHQISEW